MKRQLTILALTAVAVVAFISVALTVTSPALAGGATQISGVGYFAEGNDCTDEEGAGSDFAIKMTGDLEGCKYVFVETFECMPSGTYIETGTEIYVGSGDERDDGTFSMTYRFTAKYENCPNLVGPIFGRCQHPIIAGSGTHDYEGVTGRLDFKEDIEAGNSPYRGHLRW